MANIASSFELALYRDIAKEVQRVLDLGTAPKNSLVFDNGREVKVWPVRGVLVSDKPLYVGEDGNLYAYGKVTYELRSRFLIFTSTTEHERHGWCVCGTGRGEARLDIPSLRLILTSIKKMGITQPKT